MRSSDGDENRIDTREQLPDHTKGWFKRCNQMGRGPQQALPPSIVATPPKAWAPRRHPSV